MIVVCSGCGGDPKSSASPTAGSGGQSPSSGGQSSSSGGAAGMRGTPQPVTPADPCIAAGTCPPGKWIDVTPAGISLDPNTGCAACNFGAQDVVADPVRRGDLYAFACYQGVWKSTDYGLTWAKVSTGTNGDHIDAGRPWAAAIDPNPSRDAGTPPALYTVTGYGDQLGIYKSTDSGVNWTHYDVNNKQGMTSSDVYSIDIDPNDSNHLIAGFHDVGLSESKDGGATWATVKVPAKFGISVFVWFVQTGSAKTTTTTWLTMAQWQDNTNGMWRTEDAGANWTQVQGNLEHGHGASQIFQDGTGNIYAAGNGQTGSIFRSTDYGKTWTPTMSNMVPQNSVFGTPNYVYASLPGAFQTGQDQHLQRSPTADGVNWTDWDPIAPMGMTNGWKRAAVTYDGTHYIIVTGNWLAGFWRYVE